MRVLVISESSVHLVVAGIIRRMISYDINGTAWEERPLASRDETRAFILELKIALAREHKMYFDEREKNLQALEDLREEDYSDGPLADDRGRPLRWWVFGPVVRGCCIYVKVSMHRGTVICKSFHAPKWEMKYPLRGK